MTNNDNSVLLIEQKTNNRNNSDNSNNTDDIPNYDFKTVCMKERVFLKREKSCNIFLLQFNLENKNKNLHDIININMYGLLFNLNKDNFEKIEIKKWISPNEIEVLFLFKPFLLQRHHVLIILSGVPLFFSISYKVDLKKFFDKINGVAFESATRIEFPLLLTCF